MRSTGKGLSGTFGFQPDNSINIIMPGSLETSNRCQIVIR